MKRPLVAVALCYGGGLMLAELFQPPLSVLFPITFIALALTLVWSRARPHLLWPLLVLIGWTNLVSRTTIISPHDLRCVMKDAPALVTVRGTLSETPSLRVFVRDEEESWRTLAQVQVTELCRDGNWQSAAGPVVVSTMGALPGDFFEGRKVEITGILTPPASPVADGLFDYRTYLARQGIFFQLKVNSTNGWMVLPGGRTSPPWSDRFLAWSQRTLERGLPHRDGSLRLIWAMTLGWKTALTNEVNEPFMRSGTMHIFAISGLHIALIAGILVSLLRVLQVSRAWCGLVVIPLIWFYTAATGWQPSAIRSTVMMTIIIGGWALKRPSDLLNSLAAAAFIILLWDPQQLFQASFQLSFFVVLSLALFVPMLEEVHKAGTEHDPWLPPELRPFWKRLIYPDPLLREEAKDYWYWMGLPMHVTSGFITSFAAWFGSIPLVAYYFHLFSPVTLLANLVVVPLSSAALACNLGSLICGDWLPWATELFNHSGWFWMLAMTKVSHWATLLPGAYRYVPSPPLAGFVIYYALLIGVLSGWFFARQRRVWSIVGIVIVVALYFWHWEESRAEFQLAILPLNGGHSVFVDGPGRKDDWLIDCGNTNSVEFVTKSFLRAQGVNHVPRLLLTHGDLRYVGGTETLNQLFGVGEIYTSSIRFRSAKYRDLMSSLERTPGRHHIINCGDEAGVWHVLHPDPSDKFSQADDNALVLFGEFHGTRVLLLSDLGRPGQEALLARQPDLRADIVVAGLPEQTEPLCDALLDAIQPRLIIIADSEFPATKRASPRLRDRLAQRAMPVLYTRSTGAVTLTISKAGWIARAMDGTRIVVTPPQNQEIGIRPIPRNDGTNLVDAHRAYN
jgi:ComEC/Rec2-related protein